MTAVTRAELWADDLAAVIHELGLDRPLLVGWSYGAFVICDYARAYGQDRVGALAFVGGAVRLGEAAFGTLIGPGFLDHFVGAVADDLRRTSRRCAASCARSRPRRCRPTRSRRCWPRA
jgi:non-heme chloroperoxidase